MLTSTNGKAIYLLIADKIIDDILSGKLHPGDRLLSVRDYAAEVQVNHNTVMRAYDHLSLREVIFNRRGVGFFVSDNAPAIAENLRSSQLLGKEIDKVFRQLHLLGVSPEELAEKYRNYIENNSDKEEK